MAPITLICLVKGNTPASANAFAVDIDSGKLISHLKRAIKVKKAPEFSHFASDKLKLWKVEIRDHYDDRLAKLSLHDHDELLATRDIGDYWKENPPKRHIHVIIVPPATLSTKKREVMVDRTRSSSKGAVLPLIAVSTGKWTRSSPGGTLQETPVKLLRQTRARKESRLEGILNELSVDVMEDIVVNDGAPASSLIPSESLHHLCRKICRPETQSISCYFEFGKALKDRLDGLIEKRFVNARETLNKEVLRNFPAGTSLNFAKRKMEKARKIYDLFSVIGVSKIQRIRSFSADAISSLTKDEIGYIKGKFS